MPNFTTAIRDQTNVKPVIISQLWLSGVLLVEASILLVYIA